MSDVSLTSQPWLSVATWFTGKSVLVVGGTSGIGAAVSRAFIELGAGVTATGVSAAEVEQAGKCPVLAQARREIIDVTEEAAIERLVATLRRLDCLVNCAGAATDDEHALSDFRRIVDINVTGAMRISTAARSLLATSKGCIVTIASVLAFFGSAKYPAYAASKGAVVQLTRSLALAYATDDIRVNAVAPGYIETPMTAALRHDPKRNQEIIQRTPAGRWGKPSEIANGVVYLCSPAASFVTGATLVIDGGFSAA